MDWSIPKVWRDEHVPKKCSKTLHANHLNDLVTSSFLLLLVRHLLLEAMHLFLIASFLNHLNGLVFQYV